MSQALGRRQFLFSLASLSAACAGTLPGPFKSKAPACANGTCSMIDVHNHVFNASDLPLEGFITHIAPVPRVITRKLAHALHAALNGLTPSGKEELLAIEALAAGPIAAPAPRALPSEVVALAKGVVPRIPLVLEDVEELTRRLLETLQTISRHRYQMVAKLVETYPSVGLFTPALVDYAYWSTDSAETPLIDQLLVHEAVAQLSMRGRFKRPEARVHPFAPFNPLREVRERIQHEGAGYQPLGAGYAASGRYACDAAAAVLAANRGALNPLRAALEQHGYIGAKVYPPCGFLPLANASLERYASGALGADTQSCATRVLRVLRGRAGARDGARQQQQRLRDGLRHARRAQAMGARAGRVPQSPAQPRALRAP